MALGVAEFCDALRDGGFPGPSGPVEPHNQCAPCLWVAPEDPIHDLADDCDTRIWMTFRRVEALARVMKSGVGDGLFEAFKAPCLERV